MSQNDELARSFFQALEDGDWELLASMVSPDFTCIGPAPGPIGLAVWLEFQQAVHKAFPDWSYNIKSIETEGAEVQVRVHITATHTGPLALPLHSVPPLEATGKRVELPDEGAVLTFDKGKITCMTTLLSEGGGPEGVLSQLRDG